MWKKRRRSDQTPFRCRGGLGILENPPGPAFFKRYIEKNRPALIKGALDTWPARELWTDAWWLAQKQVQTEVYVSANGLFPDYETKPEPMTQCQMSPGELFERALGLGHHPPILHPEETYYIYGKPELFQLQSGLAAAVRKPECLSEVEAQGPVIWMSSAGCVTPAHYDLVNGVLAQVRGRKRVWLFDRSQHDRLYQRGPIFPGMDNRERQSQVDIHHPDLSKFPAFAEAEAFEVEIGPGDLLFLPSNWFHEVETLELSLSVGWSFAGGTTDSLLADMAEKFRQGNLSFADLETQLQAHPELIQKLLAHLGR